MSIFTHQSIVLQELLDYKKLTQRELAEPLGLSTGQFISNQTRGQAGIPPRYVQIWIKTFRLSKSWKNRFHEAFLKDMSERWMKEY